MCALQLSKNWKLMSGIAQSFTKFLGSLVHAALEGKVQPSILSG